MFLDFYLLLQFLEQNIQTRNSFRILLLHNVENLDHDRLICL